MQIDWFLISQIIEYFQVFVDLSTALMKSFINSVFIPILGDISWKEQSLISGWEDMYSILDI